MSEEIDIYTKLPIQVPSEEHIVVNALGGRRSHALLEKATNDVFGSTIDAELARTINVIRVLLDAKSGDGASPPPVRGATSPDGEAYDLLPGGKPEMAHPRLKVETSESGEVQVTGQARTIRELERLGKRTLGKLGAPPDALRAGAVAVESRAPRLRMDCSFTPGTWRAIAKMACNLFALERRDMFLEAAFDPIRNFVLRGGNTWDFISVNTAPLVFDAAPVAMGELDHLVAVQGDSSGAVRGLFVLYGHLELLVELGSTSIRTPFTSTYRVDQIGGRDRENDPADRSVRIPTFQPLKEIGQDAFYDTFEAGMNRIFPVAKQAADRRTLSELVRKSVTEAFGRTDGTPITPEQIRAFAQTTAERYVRAFVDDHED